MNVLYLSKLGEPDHQYLLSVGSMDDEEDGISTGDFLHDPDIEEKTEMQQDYAHCKPNISRGHDGLRR